MSCNTGLPCGQVSPKDSVVVTLNGNTLACMRAEMVKHPLDPCAPHSLRETCWSGLSLVQVLPRKRGKTVPAARWLGQFDGPPPRLPGKAAVPRLPDGVSVQDLPPTLDVTPGGDWLDEVEQQGICASCASFAMVAVIEAAARIARAKADLPSLSEAEFFFGGKRTCAKGANFDDLLDRAKDPGLVRRVDAPPYDGLQQPVPQPSPGVPRTRVGEWCSFDRHPTSIDAIRLWLYTQGPLVTANDFGLDFLLYDKGVYRPWSLPLLAHAFVVVGYNTRWKAWRCRNSFGRNWGEDGYFWLPWQENCLGLQYSYYGVQSFASIAPAP